MIGGIIKQTVQNKNEDMGKQKLGLTSSAYFRQ